MRQGGEILTDLPTISVLRRADWGLTNQALTLGDDAVNTPITNGWVGEHDTFYLEDRLLDVETSVGLAKFLNSSGGLADLGANGAAVHGSTAALYVRAAAANYNAGSAQTGDGGLMLAKQGTGTYADAA